MPFFEFLEWEKDGVKHREWFGKVSAMRKRRTELKKAPASVKRFVSGQEEVSKVVLAELLTRQERDLQTDPGST